MDIRRSPVLDDCQRADEHPLSFGGRWAHAAVGTIWNFYSPGLSLTSNAIMYDALMFGSSPNGTFVSYWVPDIFNENVEVWAQSSAGFDLSEGWRLFLNIQAPAGIFFRGYDLEIRSNIGDNTWEINRFDAFNKTSLNVVVASPLATDEYALLRYEQGALSAWRDNNTSGANWSLVVTASDSTYSFGHLGIGTDQDDDNPGWRRFGGGEIQRTQMYRWLNAPAN